MRSMPAVPRTPTIGARAVPSYQTTSVFDDTTDGASLFALHLGGFDTGVIGPRRTLR